MWVVEDADPYIYYSLVRKHHILSRLMVSIMFCLFILFNENLIIDQTSTNTAIIENKITFIGNIYANSTPLLNALNIKYDNSIPIGIPIINDLLP